MPGSYPWYEIVEGEMLEQGDILPAFPLLLPASDLAYPFEAEEVRLTQRFYDVIVLSQSCDLANDKISEVILCPHWDLEQISQLDPSLAGKGGREAIIKGNRPRYTMLAASDITAMPMGVRIVDCGRIFCIPKGFVRQFAAVQGKRLRLCPPYREHLSQAFARFFMRVGLPQNIELPK